MASANDVSIAISALDNASDVIAGVQAQLQALADQASSLDLSGGGDTLDLSGMTDQIDSAQSAMDSLASSADSMSSSLDAAGSGADSMSSAVDAATSATDAAASAADAAGQSYDVLAQAGDVAAQAMAQTATGADESAAAMQQASSAAESVSGAHSRAGNAAHEHAGAELETGEATKFAREALSQLGVPLGELPGAFGKVGEAIDAVAEGSGIASTALGVLATAGIATAGAAALESAHELVELADATRDLHEMTDLSYQTIEGFSYLMQADGASADAAARPLLIMQRNVQNLSEQLAAGQAPAGNMARAFDDLGISIESFVQMSPDEQVRTLMDAFANAPETVNKTADAFTIMGRSGAQVISVMNEGQAALDTAIGKVKQYGADTESSQTKVLAWHAAQADLNTALQGLEITIGSTVLPAMTRLTDEFSHAVLVGHDFATMLGDIKGKSSGFDVGDVAKVTQPLITILSSAAGIADVYDRWKKGQAEAAAEAEVLAKATGQSTYAFDAVAQASGMAAQVNSRAAVSFDEVAQASQHAAAATQETVNTTQQQAASLPLVGSLLSQVGQHYDTIATAAYNAAAAQQRMLDVKIDNSAIGYLQNLSSAAEGAAQAYRDAQTAQTNMFSATTPQQQAGSAALATYNLTLDQMKQQLDQLTPGTAAYISQQQAIKTYTEQYVTTQQDANRVIDDARTAIQANAKAAEDGSISWDTYNQRVNTINSSLGDNVEAVRGDEEAVLKTQQAQQKATQATQDLGAAVDDTKAARKQAADDYKIFGDNAQDASGKTDNAAKAINLAIDTILQQMDKVPTAAKQNVADAISTSMATAQGQAPAIGEAFDTGIAAGISLNQSAIAAAANAAVETAVQAARAALGNPQSPAPRTRKDVGEPAGEGVVAGYVDAVNAGKDKMSQTTKDAIQAIRDQIAETTATEKAGQDMAALMGLTGANERSLAPGAISAEGQNAGSLRQTAIDVVTQWQQAIAAMDAAQASGDQNAFAYAKAVADAWGQAAQDAYNAWHTEEQNFEHDQKAARDLAISVANDIRAANKAAAAEPGQLQDVLFPTGTKLPADSVTPQQLQQATTQMNQARATALQAYDDLHNANQAVLHDTQQLQAAVASGDQAAIAAAQNRLASDKQVQQAAQDAYSTAAAAEKQYAQTVQSDTKALEQQATEYADKKYDSVRGSLNQIVAAERQYADQITRIEAELMRDDLTPLERGMLEYKLQNLQKELDAEEDKKNKVIAMADEEAKHKEDKAKEVTDFSGNELQRLADMQRSALTAAQIGGGGGGGGAGAGGGSLSSGFGSLYPTANPSMYLTTLPDGNQFLQGVPFGGGLTEALQGYALQGQLDAQIAAQNAQRTGQIQAGPVNVQVIVSGADPRLALNQTLTSV